MRIKPVDIFMRRGRGPNLRGHGQLMTAGGEALSFLFLFLYGQVHCSGWPCAQAYIDRKSWTPESY